MDAVSGTGGGIRIMPGTSPRNDMPERKPYIYQGSGKDTLTAGLRADRLEYETANPDAIAARPPRRAPGPQPNRPPRPAAAEATQVTRESLLLRMCIPCWADDCLNCQGGTCKCACQDAPLPAPVPPAPKPEPPARCGACGYLVTAPGHLTACGQAAGRARLETAAAEYWGTP